MQCCFRMSVQTTSISFISACLLPLLLVFLSLSLVGYSPNVVLTRLRFSAMWDRLPVCSSARGSTICSVTCFWLAEASKVIGSMRHVGTSTCSPQRCTLCFCLVVARWKDRGGQTSKQWEKSSYYFLLFRVSRLCVTRCHFTLLETMYPATVLQDS